jgi:hypothetical protein
MEKDTTEWEWKQGAHTIDCSGVSDENLHVQMGAFDLIRSIQDQGISPGNL